MAKFRKIWSLTQFLHAKCPENLLKFQHYRRDCVSPLKKSCDNYKNVSLLDTTIWKHKDRVIARATETLAKLGFFRTNLSAPWEWTWMVTPESKIRRRLKRAKLTVSIMTTFLALSWALRIVFYCPSSVVKRQREAFETINIYMNEEGFLPLLHCTKSYILIGTFWYPAK